MHDAFVSYSHKDRQWVVDRLVPPLRAAGLQVLTDMDDSFLLGAPSVENMERAVSESRHTLLVLTPNWIESDWSQFEGLLTTTADPAARARKLLPLLVRRCELPARIRFLSYADFTEDDHYDSQIRRLIATLQVSGGQPPAVQPVAVAATDAVPGAAAREGFEALADLAGHDEVCLAIRDFLVGARQVVGRISALGGYKHLHDQLHALQLEIYNPIAREAANFPDSEEACENLVNHSLGFRQLLRDVADIVARNSFTRSDVSWVEQDLGPAADALDAALAARDTKSLRRALVLINRVLAREPSVVNTRLNDAARSLQLDQVIAALRTIRERIGAVDDPQRLQTFDNGVQSLDRLAANLAALVAVHDRWQALDVELRRIDAGVAHGTEDLELSWPLLREQVAALCTPASEPWASQLQVRVNGLTRAVDQAQPEKMRSAFQHVRELSTQRFLRVDLTLKQQCDELNQVCAPLVAVLTIVE